MIISLTYKKERSSFGESAAGGQTTNKSDAMYEDGAKPKAIERARYIKKTPPFHSRLIQDNR